MRARLRALAESLTGPRVVKLRDARQAFEREYVRYTIERFGDRHQAARALGIGLSTLKEKIRSR
jgi:DNA-binding NtrC family response regulator